MKKINWGVLGGGKITKKVVPAMKNTKNANYYAIASKSKANFGFLEKYGAEKVYDDYDSLLNDPDVDCVYIALATGMHYEWVMKAIKKGKHVLCEKPLALNSNQVIKITEEAQKRGVKVMEAYAYLYSPLMEKVKELLHDGAIGDIKYIHSIFSSTSNDHLNYRYNSNLGGGAAYDVGCYPVSFIREIMGEYPTEIGAYTNIHESGVDVGTTVNFRFKSGALASCYYSFDGFMKRDSHIIIGSEGMLEIKAAFNQEGICTIHLQTSEGMRVFEVDCPNNYMLEIEAMGDAILEGKPIRTDLSYSLDNAYIIETILAKGDVLKLLTNPNAMD